MLLERLAGGLELGLAGIEEGVFLAFVELDLGLAAVLPDLLGEAHGLIRVDGRVLGAVEEESLFQVGFFFKYNFSSCITLYVAIMIVILHIKYILILY